MPTNVRCAGGLIEGVVLRIIKLDTCGDEVTGTGSAQIVMDGFMKVAANPQYNTGTRQNTRKANGKLCLNFKIDDQFTNFETRSTCVWHPGIRRTRSRPGCSPPPSPHRHRLRGQRVPRHAALVVGGVAAPPQQCDSSGIARYPYHAWPHQHDGKLGQFEISSENQTTMQIMANTRAGSPLWTAGATYLGANPVSQGDHYLYNLQNTAPPPSACVIADYP
jgi:hypothetical protein